MNQRPVSHPEAGTPAAPGHRDPLCHTTTRAVAHDPVGAKQLAGQVPEATGKLACGIVCLLAGQMDQARRYLNAAAESRDATTALATAARLWSGVAALMGGDLQGVFDVEQAADAAERIRPQRGLVFETMIVELPAPADPETIERLATEVVPLVESAGGAITS